MKGPVLDWRRRLRRAFHALTSSHDVFDLTGADASSMEIVGKVLPYTMTSPARVLAVCDAIHYIVANSVEGDIVECGVWKGGSMMAAAYMLRRLGAADRHLYLFDTFEGMTPPTERDVAIDGQTADALLKRSNRQEAGSVWCLASLQEVREALSSTGYESSKLHFVKGRVEDTLPDAAPERIALLRLDTDWYESTRHELEHLYPRLVSGGVLMIDDYGHWQGARKAVDEYIEHHRLPLLLHRIDYTGRCAVKVR
jgi:hypothetical protein